MNAESKPPDLMTINIGNTHTTTVSWQREDESSALQRYSSDFRSMQSVAIHALSAHEILICSVVKACSSKLINDLGSLGRRVKLFRADLAPCIEIVPQPPERVGDDRIAACLGALSLDETCPWVVLDAGTAVTCNAVTPGKGNEPPRFEGGLIAPGTMLCLRALNQGTAQLPDLKSGGFDAADFDYLGRNTEQAILFGVLAQQAAAIAAMIEGQRAMLGEQAKVVFTGGGATFAIDALKRSGGSKFEVAHEPQLVHRGLFAAWNASKVKPD